MYYLLAAGIILTRLVLMVIWPIAVSSGQLGLGLNVDQYYVFGFMLWVGLIFVWGWKRPRIAVLAASSAWVLQLIGMRLEFLLPLLILGLVVRLENKYFYSLGVVLTLILQIFLLRPEIKQWNFVEIVKPDIVAKEVQLTLNQNYLATGRIFVLPGFIRRTLYSWPVVVADKLGKQMLGVWDLNLWLAPQSAYILLKDYSIPPKVFLPLLYFWEPIILFLGVLRQKRFKRLGLLFVAGMVPAVLVEPKWLLASGVLLMATVWSVEEKMINKISTVIFAVSGVLLMFFIHMQQQNYLRSDTYLYQQTANWILENKPNQAVVTNRFGPMEQMLRFYNVDLKNVQVRAIEKINQIDRVYIGLPGEFDEGIKPAAIIEAPDELVYKMGSGLWIVKP